jgi:hypothetical protein
VASGGIAEGRRPDDVDLGAGRDIHDQIRQFFATQAAPFKKENNWVSDTPAYKSRVTIDGEKGTLYFECDYIDIDSRQVKVVVSADQNVAKVNGTWLITSAVSATPDLGY